MPISVTEVDAIFAAAVELPSAEERAEYVQRICGDDAELRKRVEELLAAHFAAGEFLEQPAATVLHRNNDDVDASPGTVIGPYKLLQQIGEGGMGMVFMAQQEQPIQRTVALKIIKPGMDTRQVIARFEAERQALAMMDHPSIAKVLDAGTTESGHPFFVMELVKGVPITKYCDDHKLTVRHRLELVKPVCEAVQHAHQKGIIHRDLKPTNVLVAEYDNRAVPKIIDFGVAKATAQRLTQRTMFTEFGQVIGTVEYMSPEQAKFNQLDIDTRSDIYSLGVLLYELLTGSTPFERQRLREAAFDEVLRIIREEEPPRPSTRLSTSETLPSIAANRHIEPAKLSRHVRGELDWIVMKCLEKDRNRRYETANGLARDIERYLNDEPVQACPPSAAYRFRKFARRNKAVLVVTTAAIAVLMILVSGLAVSNRLIDAQRAEAEMERQRAEENLRRARVAVRDILFQAALGRGEWAKLPEPLRARFAEKTTEFYSSFIKEESANPSLQYETAVGYRSLAVLHLALKDLKQAEKFAREAVTILDQLAKDFPNSTEYRNQQAYAHYTLGGVLKRIGRKDEAKDALRRSLGLYDALISRWPDNTGFHDEMMLCFNALLPQCNNEEAAQLMKRQLEIDATRYADLVWELTSLLQRQDKLVETAEAFQQAIKANPNDPRVYAGLAVTFELLGRAKEADEAWQKALKLPTAGGANWLNNWSWELATGDPKRHDARQAVELAKKATALAPTDGSVWNTLGVAQYRADLWQPAIDTLEKSMKLRAGGDAADWFFLAMAHWQLGQKEEARKWYDKALEWMDKNFSTYSVLWSFQAEAAELLGPTYDEAVASARSAVEREPTNALHYNRLGFVLNRQGKYEEAIGAYRRSIESNPHDVRGYVNLVKVLLIQGNSTEAAESFHKLLQFQPNNLEVLDSLATKRVFNPETGHNYQRIDVPMTWDDARKLCALLGGHLATVDSSQENEFVYEHFGTDHVCWLGATDEQHESQWKWVTGEPWQYNNWSDGEPNNVDGLEHCVVFGSMLPLAVDGGSYYFNFGSKWADFVGTGIYHGVSIAHPICEWDELDPNQRDPSQPPRPSDSSDQPQPPSPASPE